MAERQQSVFKVVIHGRMRDVKVMFPRSLVDVQVEKMVDAFAKNEEFQNELSKLDDDCGISVFEDRKSGVKGIKIPDC